MSRRCVPWRRVGGSRSARRRPHRASDIPRLQVRCARGSCGHRERRRQPCRTRGCCCLGLRQPCTLGRLPWRGSTAQAACERPSSQDACAVGEPSARCHRHKRAWVHACLGARELRIECPASCRRGAAAMGAVDHRADVLRPCAGCDERQRKDEADTCEVQGHRRMMHQALWRRAIRAASNELRSRHHAPRITTSFHACIAPSVMRAYSTMLLGPTLR